jgi:quercetin dioxygenase-like cupin family protein
LPSEQRPSDELRLLILPIADGTIKVPRSCIAWHTHLLGQPLIVIAGCGRVQRWGGPIEEIRPGDVVWIESVEKHWHGATATTAMIHIAIAEALDGKVVHWMEKMTNEQYPA